MILQKEDPEFYTPVIESIKPLHASKKPKLCVGSLFEKTSQEIKFQSGHYNHTFTKEFIKQRVKIKSILKNKQYEKVEIFVGCVCFSHCAFCMQRNKEDEQSG